MVNRGMFLQKKEKKKTSDFHCDDRAGMETATFAKSSTRG